MHTHTHTEGERESERERDVKKMLQIDFYWDFRLEKEGSLPPTEQQGSSLHFTHKHIYTGLVEK